MYGLEASKWIHEDILEWKQWQWENNGKLLLNEVLLDTLGQEDQPVQKLMFDDPFLGRYFRFKLDEVWGGRGGLQHFAILAEGEMTTRVGPFVNFTYTVRESLR